MRRLPQMTPEERAAMQARGRATLAARIAHGRATLRQDYADMPEWERLAREADVRLPQSWQSLTAGQMARWLAKLSIPLDAYLAWDGSKKLADFIIRNPMWTLRAWCGLVLEHRDAMTRRQ